MEIFAPHNLPGVGMGTINSIAAVCGLIGVAATSGMLIAEGVLGTIVFVASAFGVLAVKPELGGSVAFSVTGLSVLLIAAIFRYFLTARSRAALARLVGAAADAPETRSARAAVSRRDAWAQAIAICSVLLAGALVGFAWAEWNEIPFELGDPESFTGIAIGFIAAGIGGDAAWRFLAGSTRAGGSATVVGVVVVGIAYLANVLSFYVPFFGLLVLVGAILLAVRLRRRQQRKYAGLRILN